MQTITGYQTKHAVDRLPSSGEIKQNINTNGTRTDLFSPNNVTLRSGEEVISINRPPEDLPGNSNGKVKLKSGEEVISINLDFNNLPTPVHNINVTPIPKDVNTNGTKTSLPKTIIESQEWADSINPQHNINVDPITKDVVIVGTQSSENISGFYKGPNGAKTGTIFVEGQNFHDQDREVPPIKIPEDYDSQPRYAMDGLPDGYGESVHTNGTRTSLFSQDVLSWREQSLRAGDVNLDSPFSFATNWREQRLRAGDVTLNSSP